MSRRPMTPNAPARKILLTELGTLYAQVRRYLLSQSSVLCHAPFAAASSYRGVVSLWKPWLAPL